MSYSQTTWRSKLKEQLRSRRWRTAWLMALVVSAGGLVIAAANASIGTTVGFVCSANTVLLAALTVWGFGNARQLDRALVDCESIRTSEAKFRGMFENAPIGMFQFDFNGRVLAANSAAARILGYASSDELCRTIGNFGTGLFADPNRREEWLRLLDEHGEIYDFEFEACSQDKKKIWLAQNVRMIRNMGNAFYECTLADISVRRRLEHEYRQATKMEAVGRLAGGVAHDFNNILSVILGYTELGQTGDSKRAASNELLAEIRSAAERAATLTRQLLAFSRKQTLLPQVIDLNLLVRDFSKMLQRIVGEEIRIDARLAESLGAVKADPGQIEQVIMNLAVNARDAMHDGGTLTLQTANVELDDTYTSQHPEVAAGSYVSLVIGDSGCGMSPEVRKHLFEPFFTTKPAGQGTGLGLATVYGIVKQSGGHINVYSEIGHGTTVRVYLPRVESTGLLAPRSLPAVDLPHGWETVVLVEDDDGVRMMTKAMLESLGYTVIEAAGGAEAAIACAAAAEPIHLLLTDVIMPSVRGPELAVRLLSERPVMKVLYMSGYTDDTIIPLGIAEGWPFLHKPFTRDALARKLREVLDVNDRVMPVLAKAA